MILADFVLSGSFNAFLTPRVGMAARRYCGEIPVEEIRTASCGDG